jgi:hypothetical protein
VDVDVVEHEAAAVQVHDHPVDRVRGQEQPAPHPVGVHIGDLRDVLTRLLEVEETDLFAVRRQVEPVGTEVGRGVSRDGGADLGIHAAQSAVGRVSSDERSEERAKPGTLGLP